MHERGVAQLYIFLSLYDHAQGLAAVTSSIGQRDSAQLSGGTISLVATGSAALRDILIEAPLKGSCGPLACKPRRLLVDHLRSVKCGGNGRLCIGWTRHVVWTPPVYVTLISCGLLICS